MPEEQQPGQITLTKEGLDSLYRELGEKTHVIYELNAQLTQARAMLQQLYEQYGPKDGPPDGGEVVDAEPTPLKRQKGTG